MTRFCLTLLLPTVALGGATAVIAAAAPSVPTAPKAPAPRVAPAARPTTTRTASTRPATSQPSDINVAANPLGAVDEAKAAYERADYAETLRILGRVLALKGRAAEGLDRYELLMLRADAQLHTKAQAPALQALEEAAKIAKVAQDDKRLADARALAMLIRRSKQLQFTPKAAVASKLPKSSATTGAAAATTTTTLDIADPKQRPDALAALYAEEKITARPKVQAAEKARTLPPVATALKAVVPLRDLEIAATGAEGETKETVKQLVDRVHTLMAKSLDEMTKRVTRINEHANELVTIPLATGGYSSHRRGIEGQDRNELKGIIDTCKQIVTSCRELGEEYDTGKPFEDLEDQAKDTAERANDALKEEYSR
jgi:hypothetical protein